MKRILKSRKMGYVELSSYLGIEKTQVKQYMDFIRAEGTEIPFEKRGNRHLYWIPSAPIRRNTQHVYDLPKDSQNYTVIGIMSDLHMGSKFHQAETFEKAYDDFEHAKAHLVLDAGDVTEGNGKMYRGQPYEMTHFGYNDLLQHVVKTHPQRPEIVSAKISGNHDMSFWNDVGADIVKGIADQREDIDYLGQLASWVDINNIDSYLVHPSGGTAYAKSYKSQKMVEQMAIKPDLLIRGHMHISLYLPYTGVNVIEAGTLQAQTPYLERKGLFPDVGVWIVKIKQDELGHITEFLPSWKSYQGYN